MQSAGIWAVAHSFLLLSSLVHSRRGAAAICIAFPANRIFPRQVSGCGSGSGKVLAELGLGVHMVLFFTLLSDDNRSFQMRTVRTPSGVLMVDAFLAATSVHQLLRLKLRAKSRTAMVVTVLALALWLCSGIGW